MDLTNTDAGRWAETIAASFLALGGYRIVERNFRYSRLEIDILARRDDVLAVVEVKFRRRYQKGGAVGAVSPRKQRDLETAAVGYLQASGLRGVRVRFDVVVLEAAERSLVVRHLPGAFGATGRYRA